MNWLFPKRCPVCKTFTKKDQELCLVCENDWPHVPPSHCTLCLIPFEMPQESHLCGDCLQQKKYFEHVFALGLYKNALKDLVLRFKFEGEEKLAHFFSKKVSNSVGAAMTDSMDLILPVPLHVKRLRQRGYNQSALLAKQMAHTFKKEWDPLVIKKINETSPQADLKGSERRQNLKGVFHVVKPRAVEEKRVLLVDDVYTTGTTVREVSKQLIKHGAKSVAIFVIARAC